MNKILISTICPTLNEANHIGQLLDNLLRMQPVEKEIFIADGGSTDGTVEIVEQYAIKYPEIKFVKNSGKYVSHGFNTAFPETTGKYIALIGGHTDYPDNYFRTAVHILEKNEADAVGGVLKHIGEGNIGKAIAKCMSSRFGVGGVQFRISEKRQFVDTVPFAVYKREIFEKIGLYDESLLRNQDDEFHYRANKYGFRILMTPEMKTEYRVRNSLGKLFSQYFQYGFYKPLVLKKVKSGAKLRHFIPSLFVLYLFSLPISVQFELWLLPLVGYAFLDIIFSAKSRNLVQFLFSL